MVIKEKRVNRRGDFGLKVPCEYIFEGDDLFCAWLHRKDRGEIYCREHCIFVRTHALVAAVYELKNKVCHYWLIVTQFRDRHIQVKYNEIVDSGSLKGDCVRYIQVTAICRST